MAKQILLWGQKFNIVREGLDEAQVSSFLSSLIQPRDEMMEKLGRLDDIISNIADQCRDLSGQIQHIDSTIADSAENRQDTDNDKLQHLDSLTRFAENTIIEAGKYAETIKADIEQQSQNSVKEIIAESEAQAKDILQQAKTEALNEAMQVKQEIEKLLLRSQQLVQGELKDLPNITQLSDSKGGAESSPISEYAAAAHIEYWEVTVTEDPQGQRLFGEGKYTTTSEKPEDALQIVLAPVTDFSR